jgi:uncharacterized membrane protein YfcA
MDLTPNQWLLGGSAALFIGFSKTGMPGAGILVVPLLAEAFGGRQSVGTMLPLLIVADVFAVAWYRRHAQWDRLLRLAPWVVVGMVAGGVVLKLMGDAGPDNDRMGHLIGAIVLLMLAVSVTRSRLRERQTPHSRAAVAALGSCAGFTTTASNAAGPIMAIYLQAMGMPKAQFMGTTAWFFMLVNLAKLPVFLGLSVANPANPIVSVHTALTDVALCPFIVAGAVAGRWVLPLLSQRLFDTLVLSLAAIAAVRLLVG